MMAGIGARNIKRETKTRIDQSEEQDVKRVVESQSLVFEAENGGWQKGLPLGNGSLGGIHYIQNGESRWVINHLDVIQTRSDSRFGSLEEERVWHRETRGAMPFKDYVRAMEQGKQAEWHRRQVEQSNRFRKDYEHHRAEPGDSGHPICGYLTLQVGDHPKTVQRLDVYNGVSQAEYPREKITITSFVSRAFNVQVIRVAAQRRKRLTYTIEIPEVRPNQRHPHLYADGERWWSRYILDSGFTYVLGGQFVGVENLRLHRSAGRFTGEFTVRPGREAILCLSVATSYESINGSVSSAVGHTLEKVLAAGPAAIEQEHRRWWHAFWKKSWIEIDDKVIERLWHINLYHLASTNGYGQKKTNLDAAGLMGLFMGDGRTRWGNGWFSDVNIEEAYWPCYAGNHPELAEPFIQGVRYRHELGKAVADAYFGMRGSEPGLGSPHPCVGPWYCQHLWWHYLYTGDRRYLSETAYPIMRDVGLFFLDYLRRDQHGRYYIYPSVSPEQGGMWNKNPTIDLALLKNLFSALIRAEAILAPGKIDPRWHRVRDHLVAYLTGVSHGRKVLRDSKNLAATSAVRHPAILMPIFPMDEITGALARNTVVNVSERVELVSFAQTLIAAAMARLGMGDRALRYLYDKFVNFVTLENGLFYQHTPFFWQRLDLPPKAHLSARPQPPYLDSTGSFLTAVNEMLMSGLGQEKIEVFKGCPSRWPNARFANFLAPGGFEVSALRRHGRTQWVKVRSLQGRNCVLSNPFDMAEIGDMTERGRVKQTAQRTLQFATEAGHTYLIMDARHPVRPAAHIAPLGKRSAVLAWPTRWGYQLSLGLTPRIQAQRKYDEFVRGFDFDSVFEFEKARVKPVVTNLPQGIYDILERRRPDEIRERTIAHPGGKMVVQVGGRKTTALAIKRRHQWELVGQAQLLPAIKKTGLTPVNAIFKLNRFEEPWQHAFLKDNGCLDCSAVAKNDQRYYAVHDVYAPRRKKVLLLTYFPHRIKFYANGRALWDTQDTTQIRGGECWDDREFVLQKGWNRFLLVVEPAGGEINCSLRITERMGVADTVYQYTGERSFLGKR